MECLIYWLITDDNYFFFVLHKFSNNCTDAECVQLQYEWLVYCLYAQQATKWTDDELVTERSSKY